MNYDTHINSVGDYFKWLYLPNKGQADDFNKFKLRFNYVVTY